MRLRHAIESLRHLWRFDNRWALIRSRLLARRGAVDEYRVGAVRLFADHDAGDANGIREVFATPMYRRLIAGMDLPRSISVADIGAHVGSFTLLLRALGYDIRRALCVEMNPRTCERLQRNLDANLSAGWLVRNAAVTGDGREVVVALGTGSTGDSIASGSGKAEPVAPTRIAGAAVDALIDDAFGQNVVDICKIDIEGAEHEVFRGAATGSLRRCRFLLIETHEVDGCDVQDVLTSVAALGFEPLGGGSDDPHAVRAFRNRSLGGPAAS